MPWSQSDRPIAIKTRLEDDALILQRFVLQEKLGSPFFLSATVISPGGPIATEEILGHGATVRMPAGGDGSRYINGLVNAVQQSPPGENGDFRYIISIVPHLWMLSRTNNCRIFQKQRVPDILKEIFRNHGLSDMRDRLSGRYPTIEYCVQYRESDLNFVHRLMEDEGISYYFDHTNGRHTLVLCDDISSHDLPAAQQPVRFRPAIPATADFDIVYEWCPSESIDTGVVRLNDFDFSRPRMSLHVSSHARVGHEFGELEHFDYPGKYSSPADGERYARIRLQAIQCRRRTVAIQTISRELRAGMRFELADHPQQSQNREYLTVACSLHFDAQPPAGSGRTPIESFVCRTAATAIPSDLPFRPPRTAVRPTIAGPQTAIVVGEAGQEISTDEHARVRVQFHWDRYGKADERSSCWVRVSQAWAGKGWGALTLPRIGQEVIVDFLDGDPDRPIVTGRVYNGENRPPYDPPSNRGRSTIKSLSTPDGVGFNELRLEDRKGSEQIFVHAERDVDVRVKNDSRETVGNDKHTVANGDLLCRVSGDSHELVGGDHQTRVDGQVSIATGQDLHQQVGGNLAIQTGLAIGIRGGTNIVLEAGASITLKAGGAFITVGPTGVAISGTPVLLNSGGAPGSGPQCTPTPPKAAAEADDDCSGSVTRASDPPPPPKPVAYSPAAAVLKAAARNGTPFCELCSRQSNPREIPRA